MTRNEFDKKHFLLEIEYSDAIHHFRERTPVSEEKWNLVDDWMLYTHCCSQLYNQYLFGYLKSRVDTPVKYSDYKRVSQLVSEFEVANTDILWMNENDPTVPDWRLFCESHFE